MTQAERILEYIKTHGSIDRLQALTDCGIFELSSRICNLERQGYEFVKERKTGVNQFGDTFGYVKYSFKENKDE